MVAVCGSRHAACGARQEKYKTAYYALLAASQYNSSQIAIFILYKRASLYINFKIAASWVIL